MKNEFYTVDFRECIIWFLLYKHDRMFDMKKDWWKKIVFPYEGEQQLRNHLSVLFLFQLKTWNRCKVWLAVEGRKLQRILMSL